MSLGDYSSKEVGVIVSLSHASSSGGRKGELAFLVFNFLVLSYGAFYSAWILTFFRVQKLWYGREKKSKKSKYSHSNWFKIDIFHDVKIQHEHEYLS